MLTELRAERAEHRVRVHDDLVRGERDERAAAHGVVRDVHGRRATTAADRVRDLLGSERETARGVQHDVDGYVVGGEAEGAQKLLAVLDVDVAQEREAEETHRLLPVDEGDQPALVLSLPALQEAQSLDRRTAGTLEAAG